MKKYYRIIEKEAELISFYQLCAKYGMDTNNIGEDRLVYAANSCKKGEITWQEKEDFEECFKTDDIGELSDGYHSFNELYRYRLLYNAVFFNELAKRGIYKVLKSKRHNDGEECFGGGWFIVMAELPTGQISNHYELKDWDLFKCNEVEVAPKWDGHTPQDVADRIEKYIMLDK